MKGEVVWKEEILPLVGMEKSQGTKGPGKQMVTRSPRRRK